MVIKHFSLAAALLLSLTLSNSILGSAPACEDPLLFAYLKEKMVEDASVCEWRMMKFAMMRIAQRASLAALCDGLETILNKYDALPTKPLPARILSALQHETPLSYDSHDFLCMTMRNIANAQHDAELLVAEEQASNRGAIEFDFHYLPYAKECRTGRINFIGELRTALSQLANCTTEESSQNTRQHLIDIIGTTSLDVLYNITPLCITSATQE